MNAYIIEELIKIIDKSNISIFEYSDNDMNIKITKDNCYKAENSNKAFNEIACTNKKDVYTNIISEYVGIIKLIDSSTNKPIVALGQSVKKGDLLCIINYLNIDNDILSSISGKINEICVENNTMVDYGKNLFIIKS